MSESLQEKYFKEGICFGCGPKNSQGLHIQSHVEGNTLIANWHAKEHHQAYPGILNGGIIGALLDCHSNWAAAWYLMQEKKLNHPPCTVTADFFVKLKRPTPISDPIQIRAFLIELKEDRATIGAECTTQGLITASCEGHFVAVKPGHPAYHRW